MKWFRTIVAFGVLTGMGAGCSKNTPSVPANAPTPADEQLPGQPKSMQRGLPKSS